MTAAFCVLERGSSSSKRLPAIILFYSDTSKIYFCTPNSVEEWGDPDEITLTRIIDIYLWVPRFGSAEVGCLSRCNKEDDTSSPRPSDVTIHGPVEVKQGISLQGLKDDCLLSRILLSWNWQYE